MKRKLLWILLCGSLSMSLLMACDGGQKTVGTENMDVEAVLEGKQVEDHYETGKTFLYGKEGNEVDYESAYNNFLQAVELGNVDANFYLGALSDWYHYPKQDFQVARTYYEACPENPYAQISLGYLYWNGQGVEEDKEKAKEYFNSATKNRVEGYIGLASVASSDQDYTTALEYYTKVVEEGTEQLYVASSMYEIGYLYHNGLGVEQDYKKAMEWYEKATELGNPSAMNNIGYLYQNGLGVEQDYKKAMEWYEKAVELEYAISMNNIANLYENGLGVEQDYAKAMEWYEKAAELGKANSMYFIANLYQDGLGVEQDYAKAMEWYEKAAELGEANSMFWIGYLYQNGLGVEQDYAKAMEWYEKAAELGNVFSMEAISNLYYNGLGVEQSVEKAAEWYAKAEEAKAE